MRTENLVKTMLSINLTQNVYIRSIISKLNIIATQHVNHPSTTYAIPKIEPHNPIKGLVSH